MAHERFAEALRRVGYDRWCSVEMRSLEGPDAAERLRAALTVARRVYG